MKQLTDAQGEPRAMLRFPILIHEVKFWIKKLNQEKKVFSVLNWKKVCFLEPTATAEKKKKRIYITLFEFYLQQTYCLNLP